MALIISELPIALQNQRKAFNRKTFPERLNLFSTNVPLLHPLKT